VEVMCVIYDAKIANHDVVTNSLGGSLELDSQLKLFRYKNIGK
jgi:hypothetical protein